MDKLGAMNAFAKVVALGSFAEAARALGSTRSAMSKTVMELEHVLGVRLLDRTTRRVRSTEAGLAYYERCLDILGRVEETEMQVSSLQAEPKGVLKVNGPTSFGALYLGPAVADFMAGYPELKVELTVTDRFIDPIEEGVDVTIRIAQLTDSSLTTLQRWRIMRNGEAIMVPIHSVVCSRRSPVGSPQRPGRRDPADLPRRSGHRGR